MLSSPEDDATLWSWCTFSFVEPILRLASTRMLNDTDIWGLSPFFLHRNIFRTYLEYRSRWVLSFLSVVYEVDIVPGIQLAPYCDSYWRQILWISSLTSQLNYGRRSSVSWSLLLYKR